MNILADIRTNHRRVLNPEGGWAPCIEVLLVIVEKHYVLEEGAETTMLRTTYKTNNIRFECALDGAKALRQALDEFINSETNTPS